MTVIYPISGFVAGVTRFWAAYRLHRVGYSWLQGWDRFTSSSRYMACLRWISGIFSLHARRAKSKAKSNELWRKEQESTSSSNTAADRLKPPDQCSMSWLSRVYVCVQLTSYRRPTQWRTPGGRTCSAAWQPPLLPGSGPTGRPPASGPRHPRGF